MTSLVFASNNPDKMEEIRAILGPDFRLSGLGCLHIKEDIPEPYQTLEENALAKARYVYEKCKLPCFADDTGLEVKALHGDPGVMSARYAGPDKNSMANMQKLLHQMRNISDRRARFRTVIAYIDKDGEFLFEGRVNGHIGRHVCGEAGFGYDPIFIPDRHNLTFAQMDAALKNTISHRQAAVTKLTTFLMHKFSA